MGSYEIRRHAAVLRHAALYVALALCSAGCSGGTTPPVTCSFALSPTGASYTASSGTGTVTVAANANCSWTASSDSEWVTVTGGGSGRGNGTVTYSVAANTTSARSGSLKVAGANGASGAAYHQINQAAPIASCSFALSPSSATFAASGGTATMTVTTSANCLWTATSDAAWATVTGGSSGQGNGTVTYSVAPNATTSARTASIKVVDADGQTGAVFHEIDQAAAPPSCVYALSAAGASFAAYGGTGNVAVTTTANCSWTATSDADWVVVTGGGSGQGGGAVSYLVAPNPTTSARSASIKVVDVDGQTGAVFHQISQAAAVVSCSFTLSPSTAAFAASGGTGTVRVTTDANCSWTATSDAGWATVTGGSSGQGNGTVTYTVAPNTTASARSASLKVVDSNGLSGAVFHQINQAAPPVSCSFALSPSGASYAASGGTGKVTVTTLASCSWTATSDAEWVTVTGGSGGQGSGDVTYTVAPNTTASARTASIKVVDADGQSGLVFHQISQTAPPPSCSFALSPSSASFAAAGGIGTVTVTTDATCSWTAISDSGWATVTGGSSEQGSGTVTYSVAANTTTAARSASIKVVAADGQTGAVFHQISQAGSTPPCSFALSPSSASYALSGGTGTVAVTTSASCSWTAASDAGWATVTSGSSGQGSGTVTYSVAPNPTASARTASIKVVDVDGQTGAVFHQISQAGSTILLISGAYTFTLQVDEDCGWPVSSFIWPVRVDVTSYLQGTEVGWLVFPPTASQTFNAWDLYASPTKTQLVPGPDSPGPCAAAYNVVADGGTWEAGGPTRGHDGRGEIRSGTATGARLTLVLPGSNTQWECRSDASWSLITRWSDQD